MTQATTTAAAARSAGGPAAASTRFLVELASAWTLLRLYGADHPSYKRAVASAALGVDGRGERVSITPRGFSPSPPETPGELAQLAKRLRAMGLVGLTITPGLTAEHVHALVLVLEEPERAHPGHAKADAAVEKIAAASGGRVRAVPLRLDGLRLVEGEVPIVPAAAGAGSHGNDLWQQMFSSALTPDADVAAAAELARTLEGLLGSSGRGGDGGPAGTGASTAQWDAMSRAWVRQLSRMEPAKLHEVANSAADRADQPEGADAAGNPIDAVATFLTTLSPALSQRLMQEVMAAPAVPEPVVQALAERLSPGVVLGALAAVDQDNSTHSSAALALLRKMSANIPSASAAGTLGAVSAAAGRADVDDVAATLECLLRTNREQQFVPEEYLRRRQELSARALSSDAGAAGGDDAGSAADSRSGGPIGTGTGTGAGVGTLPAYPDDADTARHAANLALDILAGAADSNADVPLAELTGALTFAGDRVGAWVKAGEFALACEAMSLAGRLVDHADPAVGAAARGFSSALIAEDLVEGAARRNADRAATVAAEAAEAAVATVAELANLLRHVDGRALATLLSSLKPRAGGGRGAGEGDAVLKAFRLVLPDLAEPARQGLFAALQGPPPPALIAVLAGMKPSDALRAVEASVPHASSVVRTALVNAIFRRDLRWPLPLIDRLLRDDEPEIRRRAVMKLVSDTDLVTAGNILGAASRAGAYEVDVALGLAELLRRHRHHPDVRRGWRQWMWSRRWWSSLLFLNTKKTRRAA